MTSSSQLDSILRDLRGFLGVFPSDRLPPKLRPGECLIANMSPSDESGTHWIAMMRKPSGEPLYFGSFGEPPDALDGILHEKTHFRQWLRGVSGEQPIAFNRLQLQALASTTCGEWSALFCLIGALPDDPTALRLWKPFKLGSAQDRDRRVRDAMGIRKNK